MTKISVLQNCKNQLQNAFNTYKNAHGVNDKPAIFEYLNNVQDSILKDLPGYLRDSEKNKIENSLSNFNIRLRKLI